MNIKMQSRTESECVRESCFDLRRARAFDIRPIVSMHDFDIRVSRKKQLDFCNILARTINKYKVWIFIRAFQPELEL